MTRKRSQRHKQAISESSNVSSIFRGGGWNEPTFSGLHHAYVQIRNDKIDIKNHIRNRCKKSVEQNVSMRCLLCSDRIATSASSFLLACNVVDTINQCRWKAPFLFPFVQNIHRRMIASLLNFLKLPKLKCSVLHCC